MHDVGARADRDQSGERAVVHEARIVSARNERREDAAAHRHQRIHRDEAGNGRKILRAHDVEAEPADAQQPRTHRQPRDRRRRRTDRTAAIVASDAGAEQEHGCQRRPAAEGVHDDRAGEIVEGRAEHRIEEVILQAVVLVPDDAFEQRIDQPDHQRRRHTLRHEFGALGDAAGNDRGNGGGERARKKNLTSVITLLGADRLSAREKRHAVSDCVADKEIRHRRDREIGQDLDERIDLVLVADRADLEEGEAPVHGEDEDGPHQ